MMTMQSNHQEPFVSVVVPAFNAETTIEDCLESLLSQTYKKLEIIVVNDGSTDATENIVNKLSRKNPVRAVNLDHKGRPFAKNIGLKYAKGEIIAFGEADAKYHSDWLKNAIKLLNKREIAGVVGPRYGWVVDTLVSKCMDLELKIRYHDPLYNPIAGWMYRKKVLLEVGAFDQCLRVAEDRDLGIRIKKKGYQIIFASDSLMYHMEPRSVTELVRRTYTHSKERLDFYMKYPREYPFLKVFSFITYIALILWSSMVSNLLFFSLIGLIPALFLGQFIRLYVKASRSGVERHARYILIISILDMIRNTFLVLGSLGAFKSYLWHKLRKSS